MPTYCYRLDSTGEIHEEIMSLADKALREGKGGKITLANGQKATRDMVSECIHHRSSAAKWPLYSRAVAVHPKDVPRAKEYARSRGVDVDFDKRGNVKLDSPAHRRAYMKIRGVHDEDGFY